MSIFDKLHHICIVVADINKAQAWYESIGIGPWQPYPPMTEYVHLSVPSVEAFRNLKYRVCNLPSIQLQLCEPGKEPSPQRQFLETRGGGVFHIGFEIPDADAAETEAKASGLGVLMRGRRENGSGFDYYDTAGLTGVILATRQTPPAK